MYIIICCSDELHKKFDEVVRSISDLEPVNIVNTYISECIKHNKLDLTDRDIGLKSKYLRLALFKCRMHRINYKLSKDNIDNRDKFMKLCKSYGMDMSTAIRIFMAKCIEYNTLDF